MEIRQEAARDSWNTPAREGRGQINISEPGNDHAQSAIEFDTPPRTSTAARVLVPEKISVQRSALVAPPAKSLAPVSTSALSTDPWGTPTQQSSYVQRSAWVARPAKSLVPVNIECIEHGSMGHGSMGHANSAKFLCPAERFGSASRKVCRAREYKLIEHRSMEHANSAKFLCPAERFSSASRKVSLSPVNTSALSTDPWSTPTRQSSNVQRSASVAPPAKSLAPVDTSALSMDPWVTPIWQSVNVQFGPAFPEGTPSGQSVISAHDAMLAPPVKSPSPVQTSEVSINPWDSPIKQCVNVQGVPVNQGDMSSREHVICALDPWGTPPRLRAQTARTTFQEDMSSRQHVICALDPWGTPPRLRAQISHTASINLGTHQYASLPTVEILTAQVLGTVSPTAIGASLPVHISAPHQLDMLGRDMQETVVSSVAIAPITLRVDPVSPPKVARKRKLTATKSLAFEKVAEENKIGRITHQKDPLVVAARNSLSLGTDDFRTEDREREVDLLL